MMTPKGLEIATKAERFLALSENAGMTRLAGLLAIVVFHEFSGEFSKKEAQEALDSVIDEHGLERWIAKDRPPGSASTAMECFLVDEIERLREALEHYARPESWESAASVWTYVGDEAKYAWGVDGTKRARKALEE